MPPKVHLSRRIQSLASRTVLVTGASRGVGRAIAIRCARNGANVALLARSGAAPSHPSMTGTLREVKQQVEAAGGRAFAAEVDLRDEGAVVSAVRSAADHFGGIDAVVNNASALDLTARPSLKTFDLLHGVNGRGAYAVTEAATPALLESDMAHVLSVSPPLRTLLPAQAAEFAKFPVYATSKYQMTLLTLGLGAVSAGRLRANTLWPHWLLRSAATARIEQLDPMMPGFSHGLDPRRFAECVHAILVSDAEQESCLDSDLAFDGAPPPPRLDQVAVEDIFCTYGDDSGCSHGHRTRRSSRYWRGAESHAECAVATE